MITPPLFAEAKGARFLNKKSPTRRLARRRLANIGRQPNAF